LIQLIELTEALGRSHIGPGAGVELGAHCFIVHRGAQDGRQWGFAAAGVAGGMSQYGGANSAAR
jgi:hypothetical protein